MAAQTIITPNLNVTRAVPRAGARRLTPEVLLLALGILAYTLLVGGASVLRHHQFLSFAYDLGIYDQALWLMANNRDLHINVRMLHIFGDHFTPILYLLALLYRLGFNTDGLLWCQSFGLALGAVPLYLMGKKISESGWIGLLAGVTYLLYPALRGMNLFDFHPIVLATPGILFAVYFAFEKRPIPLLAACVWCLLCKQETALVVAALGVWYGFRFRSRFGVGLSAGALLYFFLALRAQAYYAGVQESSYIALYDRFGRNAGEVARTFLLTPWVPLSALNYGEVVSYLLLLLAPLALLPLRSPGILWMAALPLALNLFSYRAAMRSIDFQYTALLTPLLCIAATLAVARIHPGRERRFLAGLWLSCAVLSNFLIYPQFQRELTEKWRIPHNVKALEAALHTIPPDATVSATNRLVPHLSGRAGTFLFPNPFWPLATGPGRDALRQQLGEAFPPFDRNAMQRALTNCKVEYMVLGYELNRTHSAFPLRGVDNVPILAETLRNPSYGLITDQGGVWILRKGADHAAGLRRLHLRPTDPPAAFERRVEDAKPF